MTKNKPYGFDLGIGEVDKLIIWLTGQTSSGKSTLAAVLKKKIPQSIILDGDQLRRVWTDLGFSTKDRLENNKRFLRLAHILNNQDYNVIISVICPFEIFRVDTKKEFPRIKFVYLDKKNIIVDKNHPYEIPKHPDITVYLDTQTPEMEAEIVIKNFFYRHSTKI